MGDRSCLLSAQMAFRVYTVAFIEQTTKTHSTFFSIQLYNRFLNGNCFFQVLNPCSLSFKYLTPASTEGGQDISITLEEMVFEFSPGLFTTISNVVTALTGQQKVAVFMSWTFIQTELQHLSPPPWQIPIQISAPLSHPSAAKVNSLPLNTITITTWILVEKT